MASRENTCVQTAVPVAAMPDEGMRELVAVGLAAEMAGWPPEQAFEAALLLRIHGTAVLTSVEAFMHAARWVQ
jgi:hypothetical protein